MQKGTFELEDSRGQQRVFETFDADLAQSIDEAIGRKLGASVVDAIHLHLEKFHGIAEPQVPQHLEALGVALDHLSGASSRTIEKQ